MTDALVAVLLTVFAGLVGAFIENRREHSRWLRNERMRAYATFLGEMDRYRLLLGGPEARKVQMTDFVTDTRRAGAGLSLVGSEMVLTYANAMSTAIGAALTDPARNLEDYTLARDGFVQAATWSARTVGRRATRRLNRVLAGKRPGPLGRLEMRVHARLHRYDFPPLP